MKSRMISLLPIVWFLLCIFFSGIKSFVIQYDGSKAFYYSADEHLQLCITVLSIVIICGFAMYCGCLKKLFDFVIFIALYLFFKIMIFIMELISSDFSNLLYTIYFSPICAIYENLDIFSYIFYEVLFIISFLIGYVLKKPKLRNEQ